MRVHTTSGLPFFRTDGLNIFGLHGLKVSGRCEQAGLKSAAGGSRHAAAGWGGELLLGLEAVTPAPLP
jgi:hypothetical protein